MHTTTVEPPLPIHPLEPADKPFNSYERHVADVMQPPPALPIPPAHPPPTFATWRNALIPGRRRKNYPAIPTFFEFSESSDVTIFDADRFSNAYD